MPEVVPSQPEEPPAESEQTPAEEEATPEEVADPEEGTPRTGPTPSSSDPVPSPEETAESTSGEPDPDGALLEEETTEEDIGAQGEIEDMSLDSLLEVVASEMNEGVVSATQTALQVREAPAIITVITQQDIQRRGYQTVSQALRGVPGLHVIEDMVYQSVGVRGVFSAPNSPNDTIRVLLNGQAVSFRPTNSTFLSWDLIPIEAVERIEVLRGAASALYGANALLGVINIITFDGRIEETGRRPDHQVSLGGYAVQNPRQTAGGGVGSFLTTKNWRRGRYLVTGLAHRGNRSGVIIPGIEDLVRDDAWLSDPSTFPSPDRYPSPGVSSSARSFLERNAVSQDDIDTSFSGYGIVAVEPASNLEIRLDGHIQYSERTPSWLPETALTDSRLTHLNGMTRLALAWNERAESGPSLLASVTYASGKPTDRERFIDRLSPTSTRRRSFGYQTIEGVLRGRYSWNARNVLTLGADYTHDRQRLLSTLEESDSGTLTIGNFPKTTFANLGIFAQLLTNPIGPLTIAAGVRADYNSHIACSGREWDCVGSRDSVERRESIRDATTTIDDRGLFQLSTRLALSLQLPRHTFVKAIYGSAFKPPSPYQLYHRPITREGADFGNPALRPQTADTFELGVGYGHEGLEVSLTGFATLLNDYIIYLVENNRVVTRNSEARFAGVEGSVLYSVSDLIKVMGSFDWLPFSEITPLQNPDESEFAWERSPLNASIPGGRYPDWSARIGFNLNFVRVVINAGFRVVGPRRASLTNNVLFDRDIANTYEFDPYFTGDLTVGSRGLKLINELDTDIQLSVHAAPGSFVEPGTGGVDIPNLGTRIMLKVRQEL